MRGRMLKEGNNGQTDARTHGRREKDRLAMNRWRVCVHIYIYIYIYICIYIYIYIYIYICACVYVYVRVCVRVCELSRYSACMYVHMFACVCLSVSGCV